MDKAYASTLIGKKSEERKSKIEADWRKLYEEFQKQNKIIDKAGEGSRRANTAQKKLNSLYKKMDKFKENKDIAVVQALKDYDLVKKYGESAMEARSFGTDRDVGHTSNKQKESPIRRTHEVDLKKGKAKGGYVKKYANGGSVRKVRV